MAERENRVASARSTLPLPPRERLSAGGIHHRLVELYAPPSVLVNARHEIVHVSEHAGDYLQYLGGEPTTDLLKAIRPELRLDLHTALVQAARQQTDVEAQPLPVRIGDRTVDVTMLVRPMRHEGDPAHGYALVLFQTAPPSDAARRQLETEAEDLRACNEQLQTTNEELRSSTEEVEQRLPEAQAELEAHVRQRTAQLAAANAALDRELSERLEDDRRIRALIRRLITIQEDERRRIARDLHDHLGQEVAGLRLRMSGLLNHTAGNGDLKPSLEDALRSIDRLDRDLDFFTWQLRPAALADLGLVATVRKYVEEWSKEFDTPADFHTRGLDGASLPYEIEINLYRVTQEALHNIHKHARADRAGVILERRDSEVLLVIEDDGIGFERQRDPRAGSDRGIGLVGIGERVAVMGGSLEIESSPGRGTTIFVRVPISGPLAGDASTES